MKPRLLRIVAPMTTDNFSPKHPMRYKGTYWATYGASVLRQLETLGVEVAPPKQPLQAFTIDWCFDVGEEYARWVRTGYCYSDYGPDAASWAGSHISALFALKWHPSRHKNQFPFPVYPAGMPLVLGRGGYDHARFIEELPELRCIKDEEDQIEDLYFNSFTFRTIGRASRPGRYPNRTSFARSLARHPYAKTGYATGSKFHTEVARHLWALNLCGNGDSIDRKVTIFCAIGAAIISDRGLEDLELPSAGRFEHGRNIWFVDRPSQLETAKECVTGATWRKLVEGSRKLYEESMEDGAVARYLRDSAALQLREEAIK